VELEVPEGTLLADGFEEAFIGVTEPQPGRPSCAVYDFDDCVSVLVRRDGMAYDEAVEFMLFNVTDAYVGDQTPIFVDTRLQKTKGTKCKK
jgi:hypothetical protein